MNIRKQLCIKFDNDEFIAVSAAHQKAEKIAGFSLTMKNFILWLINERKLN